MYELMGRAHAWIVQERGQGTVEYVGLILLLGRDPRRRRHGGGHVRRGGRDPQDRGEQAQAGDRQGQQVAAVREPTRRFARGAVPDWRRGRPVPPHPMRCAAARSACSTPASAASRCCTSCSCSCRTRTSCTSRTRRACRTARGPREEIEAFSLEVAEELLDAADQAARGRVQQRVVGGAAGAARSADADDAGGRRPRRRPARGRHGRGRHAQRPRRLHGDRGDGHERRVRASDRRRGPVRDRRRASPARRWCR